MAAHSKKMLILACTILIQCQCVTNEQMDGQMDRRPGHG